jgi:hypothetical protein
MKPILLIGDIHGQLDRLLALLRSASLIDEKGIWCGGDQEVWFIGDFFDRGPDGFGAMELVMRLQAQAAAHGGRVGALLGNHDVLLLSAYHFGDHPAGGPGGTFRTDWERNGGVASDLEQLTPAHIEWLSTLPALVKIGDTLLAHADSLLYREYGNTVETVNSAFTSILQGRDPVAWDLILERFSDRLAFWEDPSLVAPFLQTFGAKRLIHGHTPIQRMKHIASDSVTKAFTYAQGLCVNIDGGLYLGGQGFIYSHQA